MSRLAFILLTLGAFFWRVQGLNWQSLWRDEVDAIYFATRHLPETLMMFVQPGQNGPLYFVALRPWFDLVGSSEFALRFPSAAAGTLAVLVTWQVARRLLPLTPFGTDQSNVVAWVAAVSMAFNPYQLWYGQEGKMYAVITLLVLLATWWWLEGIVRGGWRPWLAYLVTVSLAMYTHLLLILLFPVHFVWFWLAWPQSRHHWRGYALALAGLTLPYFPMLWWQWDLLTIDIKRTGFTFTPPLEMGRTLLLNHSRGFMPPSDVMGDLLWLIPIFFLGAAGLILGMGEIAARRGVVSGPDAAMPDDLMPGDTISDHTLPDDARPDDARPDDARPDDARPDNDRRGELYLAAWRRWMLLVTWALLPVVGIYALSLRQPIFTDRYVIWIAPALMMLVALGVVVVRRYAWVMGRVLATGLLLYVLGFWLYAGWQQKSEATKYDLRGGVTYLAQERTPDALLILQIPHMEWPYRYYTSDFGPRPFDNSEARLAPWIGGMWTNQGWEDGVARADVDRQMRVQTAGYTDIWLLRSEVEMWDQRQLMDEWLNQHGEIVGRADFHGVQVRHYRLHAAVATLPIVCEPAPAAQPSRFATVRPGLPGHLLATHPLQW